MFARSRRRRHQVLIHNIPALHARLSRLCSNPKVCDRTAGKHERWRPVACRGRVLQFVTGEEREYSEGFCQEYVLALADSSLPIRKFLERFSGPNAPLSCAVAKSWGCAPGEVAPRAKKQRLRFPTSMAAQTSGWLKFCHTVERLSIESGRQPSFGKRQQLIPDGLSDPVAHLKKALSLEHPFDSMESLKKHHLDAFTWIGKTGEDVTRLRYKKLGAIRKLSKSAQILNRQKQLDQESSWTAKKLGNHFRVALMEALQEGGQSHPNPLQPGASHCR